MQPIDEISPRIDVFKGDLQQLSDARVVQKHITFGDCFILDMDRYFNLKSAVAERSSLHPSEIIMVGSGKLGFSIAPQKRFRHFGNDSDIDLAVVSAPLFDQMWTEVFEYSREGAYWPEAGEFKNYLFRGWIRPDKLPSAHTFQVRRDWWDFFQELEKNGQYGPYKLRAGVYRTWHFLESYQATAVLGCRGG